KPGASRRGRHSHRYEGHPAAHSWETRPRVECRRKPASLDSFSMSQPLRGPDVYKELAPVGVPLASAVPPSQKEEGWQGQGGSECVFLLADQHVLAFDIVEAVPDIEHRDLAW